MAMGTVTVTLNQKDMVIAMTQNWWQKTQL